MIARFSATSRKLAGLSARSLGWTPETFWNATPSELGLALQPEDDTAHEPPPRELIAAMIERDRNERRF